MLEVDIGAAILPVEQKLTSGLPSDAQRLEMTPASGSGGDPQTAYRLASGEWLVGPAGFEPAT